MLVVGLAAIAGASIPTSLLLGGAMFGFQAAIGTVNDIVDAPLDRRSQPDKPIASGAISTRVAGAVAIIGATVGLLISGSFGTTVFALGIVGLGSGIAYDVRLRRMGLGWLAFAVAFPTLLVWTWLAAAESLPPGWVALLPMAALAGPAIHLANAFVDSDADTEAGLRTLATQLGPTRSIRVLGGLQLAVFGLGWVSLLVITEPTVPIIAGAGVASVLAGAGVWMSARTATVTRDRGWMLQAAAVAAMGALWVAAAAAI
jgi:geranylgeranylglycerol-phosphate geranylgeranyltransferase